MKLKNLIFLTAYFIVAYGLVAAVTLANNHLHWVEPGRLFACLYLLPFLGITLIYFTKYRKTDRLVQRGQRQDLRRR